MPNEPIVEVEDEIAEVPEVNEGEEDLTDYKALAAKNAGIAKRYKTKLEKSKIDAKVEAKVEKLQTENSKKEFDYAEKAFLKVSDVDPEDFDLVYRAKTAWGETLEETLADEALQSKLKARKEGRIAKAAIPSSTGRSGGSNAKEGVDYWLQKGELPPKEAGDKLRQQYVEEKRKRSSSSTPHFYNS